MKRMSRRKRRMRVIRNWICLILAVLIIVAVVIIIVANVGKHNKPVVPTTSTTTSGIEEVTSTQKADNTDDTNSQNTSSEESTQQTVVDTTAPVIRGEDKVFVSIGSKVKYKSYVYVKDDIDPSPKLSVNNNDVNLSKEGEYTVIYTATDASGNSSTKNMIIVVSEAQEPNVDEAVIYAKADEVLSQIITDGMTPLEKVEAVFLYVRESFTYVKDNNYWEYKQEAYHMMMDMTDNCYANVCVSRLLLERLGFQSYMVVGEMGYVDEHHYWNMVSIDDGNTWYQYDSAWWTWMHDEYPMCMLTDDQIMEISNAHDGIVDFAGCADPDTPKEPLWNPQEWGYHSDYLNW